MYIRFCAALAFAATLFGQNIDSSRLRYTAPGGVQRSLYNKFQDVINVKDYGAKGDSLTDDTAAFQAAVNAIPVNGYGTVYCPDTAATYKLNSNVVTNRRNPLFILAFGCRLSGTGTLPLATQWNTRGDLTLPGAITLPGNITSSGSVSAATTVSAADVTASDAITATNGITSTNGPLATPAIKAGSANSVIIYDKNGVQQYLFSPPYFLLGNPASTRLIGPFVASNTYTLYDYNAAANLAAFSSSLTEFFQPVKFDGNITSAITVTGQIQSTTGGFKFPDNTVQTSAGVQPSATVISVNTNVSSSGSKNQTFIASGNITVTLYAASAVPGGIVTVKKTDTNANSITILSLGGTMDGQTSITLARQFDSYTFLSDGTNWNLI